MCIEALFCECSDLKLPWVMLLGFSCMITGAKQESEHPGDLPSFLEEENQ